ncbi:MAG: D-glycerate dehydrogenase [Dehalococcoidia bacterium]|nr:D-glycerate dehydrogenase [Dehalococcoidia bacterium]
MNVYVSYWLPEAPMEVLRQHHTVVANDKPQLPSPDELVSQLNDADAFLCVGSRVDKTVLDQVGPRLKIIANWGVGYNNIDAVYAAERGIMVTNTPDVLTETTADLSWAILMAVARRVVEADKHLRAGEFKGFAPFTMLGADVWGKTLGIIGMGRIGQAVGRRARGFGMKVLYYNRKRVAPGLEQEIGAQYTEIDTLLAQSDFVSLYVPLSDETRHLMDKRRLSLMKPSAFLVNVSRGPVVDEQALIEALLEKKIAGAALDVYEREPEVTPGLLELPNVVLTPHIGSGSWETRTNMAHVSVRNIIAALNGETPPNLVNSPSPR